MALAAASAPAQAESRTHVVAAGDTLWELAEAHGCTVAQLREANGLSRGDALVRGRDLLERVPGFDHVVAGRRALARGNF